MRFSKTNIRLWSCTPEPFKRNDRRPIAPTSTLFDTVAYQSKINILSMNEPVMGIAGTGCRGTT